MYKWTKDSLERIPETGFVSEGIWERRDIQRVLQRVPEALGGNITIIAEEFSGFIGSDRAIDLLGVEQTKSPGEGRLVVIELKRDDDGGHMELQAIRYAAMVSQMDFDQCVEVYRHYLGKHDPEKLEGAREMLVAFLGSEHGEDPIITSDPRIVLASQGFSKEITTAVLWLNERDLDITCVELKPYRKADEILVDINQVLPLPSAEDYLITIKRKVEIANEQKKKRRNVLKTLVTHSIIEPGDTIVLMQWNDPEKTIDQSDPKFRAKFADPIEQWKNIIWEQDGKAYSLTNLSQVMLEMGLAPFTVSGKRAKWVASAFTNWALASDPERSLWELANEANRNV